MAVVKSLLILYLFTALQFGISSGAIMASSSAEDTDAEDEEDQEEPEEDLPSCERHKTIICDCGPAGIGERVSIRVKICPMKNPLTGESFCEPCDSKEREDKLCKMFKNCEKCAADRKFCMSCPPGRDGRYCEDITPLIPDEAPQKRLPPPSSSKRKYEEPQDTPESMESLDETMEDIDDRREENYDRPKPPKKEDYGRVRDRPRNEERYRDRKNEDIDPYQDRRNEEIRPLRPHKEDESENRWKSRKGESERVREPKKEERTFQESRKEDLQQQQYDEPIRKDERMDDDKMEDLQQDGIPEPKPKSLDVQDPSSVNLADGLGEGIFEKIFDDIPDGGFDAISDNEYDDDLSSYSDMNDVRPLADTDAQLAIYSDPKSNQKQESRLKAKTSKKPMAKSTLGDSKPLYDNFSDTLTTTVPLEETTSNDISDLDLKVVYPIHVHYPIGKPIDQHRVQRALKPASTCLLPTTSRTVDFECTYHLTKVTCSQRCAWGYTFEEGTVRQNQCRHKTNEWQYVISQECTSFVNCQLDLKGSGGHLSCASHMVDYPTYCNITCFSSGKTEHHVCSIDSNWTPPLPECVERRGGVSVVPIACFDDELQEDPRDPEKRKKRQRTRSRQDVTE